MYSVYNEICYASRSVQSRQIRLFFASNTVQNVALYLWVELSLTFRIFTIWSEIVFTLFWTFLFIYWLKCGWIIYCILTATANWDTESNVSFMHIPSLSSQITRCIEKRTVFLSFVLKTLSIHSQTVTFEHMTTFCAWTRPYVIISISPQFNSSLATVTL